MRLEQWKGLRPWRNISEINKFKTTEIIKYPLNKHRISIDLKESLKTLLVFFIPISFFPDYSIYFGSLQANYLLLFMCYY